MPEHLQVVDPNGELYSELKGLSNGELKQELVKALRVTAQQLIRLATVVRILEDRGEDLEALKLGILTIIRRIAYGQLAVDAVVRFYGRPILLKRIETLPMPDQERLAGGDPVRVIVRENGETTHKLVDPLKLSRAQVFQVFAVGHMRDDVEQSQIVSEREPPPHQVVVARLRPDRERSGLVFGRSFAPQAEILDALSELRGAADDGERNVKLSVSLSEEEHRRLKTAAAQSKRTIAEMARALLRAGGGI